MLEFDGMGPRMPRAKSLSWRRAGIAAAVLVLIAGSAFAQAQSDDAGPAGQLPTPTPPTSQGGDVPSLRAQAPQAAATETGNFRELNKLVLKGWVTAVPTYEDTLTGDAGGWRTALARYGIGFTFWSLNLGAYDMAQAGRHQTGAQQYNGQKFTYQTGNQTGVVTYDLGRVGLEGGQLAAIIAGSTNGYEARDGLDGLRMKGLSWYQPLAGGKVEMELGVIANQTDYMGTSVGGSLSGGALGPQASIPVEAGLSYGQYGAPTISARINWSDYFYTRTGVQRSISPKGSTTEHDANASGLEFDSPGAKALVIQELGYRVASAPGVHSFWLRGGGLYNNSAYKSFDDGELRHNSFVYAAADYQLTQPDAHAAGRGIYVGATFDGAPGDVDLINRYYEARAYAKGLFDSRPYDMGAIVAAVNVYSPEGRVANKVGNFTPYSTTQSYTASYSFKITNGLYVQPGLGIVVHPVYNREIGTAWNALLNLVAFF